MDELTRRALEAINRRFYGERAADFDASRSRPWQGWDRVLAGLPRDQPWRVLDLGCGNGRLLAHVRLAGIELAQWQGIDSCRALIDLARARYPLPFARFEHAELLDPDGTPRLPGGAFDMVALMGVLHHVPSERARRALVHAAFERTSPGGALVLTVWRFEHDSRLSKRTVPWALAKAREPELQQLDLSQLELGDTLLQWHKGAPGLRYCHAITAQEIERWLAGLPATVDRFYADGDGELNEYLVLRR